MQLGRFFGLFCVVIGGIFTYLGFTMLDEAGVTLRIFMVGPGFIGLGLAMIILPGGDITAAQSRNKEKDPKTFMTEAPMMHKAAWVIGFVGGLLISDLIFK